MPTTTTTQTDDTNFKYTGYRGHEYDFGILVAKQNDRVMEAGRSKHKSDDELNIWLDTINDLEDLLFGFWTDEDVKTNYREDLKKLRNLTTKTKEDKIILGHHKIRALMKLQHRLDFQGLKRVTLEA